MNSTNLSYQLLVPLIHQKEQTASVGGRKLALDVVLAMIYPHIAQNQLETETNKSLL